MNALLKRFFAYIYKPFHRLWLWTRPSYIRHRTPYQKRFDVKIQYSFVGCLIGMLVVGFLIYLRPHTPRKITQLIEVEEQVQMQEELLPMTSHEPELALEESVPLSEDSEEIVSQITTTEKEIATTELTLKERETLSGLLKRADVSLGEALDACKALELVFEIKKLRPGQTFEIFFIEDSFQGLKFEDRSGQTISVLKNKKGEFIPQTKEGIIENKRFALQGFLVDSFSVSAQKIGVPKNVIHQATLAMDGKIDFKKDLKQGAPFKVVYEQKMTETGKLVGKSQLLYVSLTTQKATYQRYFFIDSTGVQGYYDEKGQSTPQTLMKRPLGNVRVSSPFGMRLHPILGYQIQHKGIDFAATTGTPIPAGGDGIIQKIGRNGGYGKYIQIKHNDTYSTAYGHLNAFADGLHVGSNVKKGEIIGYVGSTGRSTGPHLHYEVIKNRQPVSPLKTHTIPRRVLKNQSLEQFKKKKQLIDSIETTVVSVEEVPEKTETKEEVLTENKPLTDTPAEPDKPDVVPEKKQSISQESKPFPKEKPAIPQAVIDAKNQKQSQTSTQNAEVSKTNN